MTWWSRLWRRSGGAGARQGAIYRIRLTLPGRIEVVRPDDTMRVWEDRSRSVLSLAAFKFPNFSDEAAMRQWCRAALMVKKVVRRAEVKGIVIVSGFQGCS